MLRCRVVFEMDLLGQSALLIGMTSFALGFSVLARNVRNKLFISYSFLTTLISLWALMFTLEKIWPGYDFYRWHLFFNIWLAPAGLVFIGVLIRIQDRIARRIFGSDDFFVAGFHHCAWLGTGFVQLGESGDLLSPGYDRAFDFSHDVDRPRFAAGSATPPQTADRRTSSSQPDLLRRPDCFGDLCHGPCSLDGDGDPVDGKHTADSLSLFHHTGDHAAAPFEFRGAGFAVFGPFAGCSDFDRSLLASGRLD